MLTWPGNILSNNSYVCVTQFLSCFRYYSLYSAQIFELYQSIFYCLLLDPMKQDTNDRCCILQPHPNMTVSSSFAYNLISLKRLLRLLQLSGSQDTEAVLSLLLLLLSRFSRVRLCPTPQTAAHQAPPSLGFSRQEHWSGLPFPSPAHEVRSESEVAQPCPTLSDPMDRSPARPSVHGIFQARGLGWGATAFSRACCHQKYSNINRKIKWHKIFCFPYYTDHKFKNISDKEPILPSFILKRILQDQNIMQTDHDSRVYP